MMAYQKIKRVLDESGVDFAIHEHKPIQTFYDAKKYLPFPPQSTVKTIVFRLKDAFWILAAVRGPDRIDYRKLAVAFGVKRTDLRSVSSQEVSSSLGYEIGGVCPIPITENIKVVFDSHLQEMDTIYCGGGRNDRTLQIQFDDLLHVSEGRVVPLVKE